MILITSHYICFQLIFLSLAPMYSVHILSTVKLSILFHLRRECFFSDKFQEAKSEQKCVNRKQIFKLTIILERIF